MKEFMNKNLVSLVVVIVLAAMFCTVSGCGAVDGALEDIAGTANLFRKMTEPMKENARAKDAELNARWLTLWQARREGVAKLNAK